MTDGTRIAGAIGLVTGGIAAAFALASCCAIPIVLAAAGLGAGWLAPIVSASQPHADVLTGVSAVALLGSVGVVARAPTACEPGSVCARPWFRRAVIAAAIVGAALLVLSKLYA
jgi:mercuric ion transport protein